MAKSKKLSGGVLKREYLTDPIAIHKLRMIELAEGKNLVEYKDINNKIQTTSAGGVNILYVIDMQNDFIRPSPPVHDGRFSVLGGDSVVEELVPFIKNNKRYFHKMIFSRDYHQENHCGFKDNGGIHPPHCVQKSVGASFDDRIKRLLTCELLNNKEDFEKTEILFKAMEMESFGASIATNKDGKWYNDHSTINGGNPGVCCKDKCDSLGDDDKCLNLTGGFKIASNRPKLENIGDFIETKDLIQKYDIGDVIDEIAQPKKYHNIYITGLAGCHCVSETATNIADYFNSEIFTKKFPQFEYQIYIIEDLTRYAFVPLLVGPPVFTKDLILERLDNQTKDDLSLYIFNHDMTGNFKLMSKEEVFSQVDSIAAAATGTNPLQYFHYLVSLKVTIDKYSNYDSKIKLIMNEDDENLSTRLRVDSTSGGGRKTQKKQKRKKSKTRKGKTGKIRKNRKNKKLSKRHRH